MSAAELQEIITHFREATSINLHLLKGFKILQKHESAGTPLGFDFTVENPGGLAQTVRGSSHMAEDHDHKGHYAPWTSSTTNFGFTEVTQPDLKIRKWPKAVHIDFAIGASKCPCGIHLDQDHRVVGRDRDGMAICTYANDPRNRRPLSSRQ
jgi:hypothetical protein